MTSDKTNLAQLLKDAANLPADRRNQIEPQLAAREAAAQAITVAAQALVAAWEQLYKASAELSTAIKLHGIEGVPPARIKPNTLTYAVGAELWRIGCRGKSAASPLKLPCHCAAAAPVVRPDLLPPLVELIREANDRVRVRL